MEEPNVHVKVSAPTETNIDVLDNLSDDLDDGADLPPLRMHATRVPERLSGSSANMIIPKEIMDQKLLGGRRRFYNQKEGGGGAGGGSRSNTENTMESGSSISSLQDLEDLDPDILLDRVGMEDLDLSSIQRNVYELQTNNTVLPMLNERVSDETLNDDHAFSNLNFNKKMTKDTMSRDVAGGGMDVLPMLNERVSDETLDDVHAFSNLNPHKSKTKDCCTSRDSSVAGGMDVLEECEEGEEYEDTIHPEVILENMESLQIGNKEDEDGSSIPTDFAPFCSDARVI